MQNFVVYKDFAKVVTINKLVTTLNVMHTEFLRKKFRLELSVHYI